MILYEYTMLGHDLRNPRVELAYRTKFGSMNHGRTTYIERECWLKLMDLQIYNFSW